MSSFCICKSYSHFFSKNTCELDIVLTRTVNILTTNELVKLTMLWTTGPWHLLFVTIFWWCITTASNFEENLVTTPGNILNFREDSDHHIPQLYPQGFESETRNQIALHIPSPLTFITLSPYIIYKLINQAPTRRLIHLQKSRKSKSTDLLC